MAAVWGAGGRAAISGGLGLPLALLPLLQGGGRPPPSPAAVADVRLVPLGTAPLSLAAAVRVVSARAGAEAAGSLTERILADLAGPGGAGFVAHAGLVAYLAVDDGRAEWLLPALAYRAASSALELAPAEARAALHTLAGGRKTPLHLAAMLKQQPATTTLRGGEGAAPAPAAAAAGAAIEALTCEELSQGGSSSALLTLRPPFKLAFALASNTQGRVLLRWDSLGGGGGRGGWVYGSTLLDDFAFFKASVAWLLARPGLAAKVSAAALAAFAIEGVGIRSAEAPPDDGGDTPRMVCRPPQTLAELASLPIVAAIATVSARTSPRLAPAFEFLRDLCAEEGALAASSASERAAQYVREAGVHIVWWLQKLAEEDQGSAGAYTPGGELHGVGLTPPALRRVFGAIRSVQATGFNTATPAPWKELSPARTPPTPAAVSAAALSPALPAWLLQAHARADHDRKRSKMPAQKSLHATGRVAPPHPKRVA